MEVKDHLAATGYTMKQKLFTPTQVQHVQEMHRQIALRYPNEK